MGRAGYQGPDRARTTFALESVVQDRVVCREDIDDANDQPQTRLIDI